MTVSAKMIADSVSAEGYRMRSFEICAHRFILAEINTHKKLSKNYRSSRAVPVRKLLEEVRNRPAMPVVWLKNKPGMQATEPMSPDEEEDARFEWNQAANSASYYAETLADTGLHKQWANRVIEPFLMVHGVISGTDFNNFYALRRAPDAQPEFKALADAMWEAEQASIPDRLGPGDWHLPYVSEEECTYLWGTKPNSSRYDHPGIPLSVARVARVSIKPFDSDRTDIEKDLALYDRLLKDVHMSPFEHQSTPDIWTDYSVHHGSSQSYGWKHLRQHGNLTGWRQYRKTIPNEWVPG